MKKYGKRMLGLLLVGGMLLAMLAGCSAPKLVLGGTPKTVGTVAGRDIPTGEYLAYMYTAYLNMYYSNGLYQYAQYGMDPWEETFSYGEGDSAQNVVLEEYIRLTTKDTIVRQEALKQLLEKHAITWDADEVKSLEEGYTLSESETLEMGINRDALLNVYMNLNLNESSLLNGLYGEGGKREVSEADRKKYFDENYLSYKIISIELLDDEGEKRSDENKQEKLVLLNGYLETYKKEQNFEALVDAYAKSQAEEDTEVTASKDEDNRKDSDANNMDEYLVKEIRKLEIGQAAVVEYSASGSTPTAALILRLDIHDATKKLFEESNEDIIHALKDEELQKEIDEKIKTIIIDLKKSAIKTCKPQNFEKSVG